MSDDTHHISRETGEDDEDLDRQEEQLEETLDESGEHADPGERFHTEGGGEEPPPGSPRDDDPARPEPNPGDAF